MSQLHFGPGMRVRVEYSKRGGDTPRNDEGRGSGYSMNEPIKGNAEGGCFLVSVFLDTHGGNVLWSFLHGSPFRVHTY